MLCDTLHLDYDSMAITENAIVFKSLDENTMSMRTVTIPLRNMINAEYYNLFK